MSTKKDTFNFLTGRQNSFLVPFENSPYLVHKECVASLMQLKESLKSFGHELYLVSSFRNFQDQQRIWNEKVQGKRLLMDLEGRSVDVKKCSDDDIVSFILRWSALPGCSRHHWGTDVDVIDKQAISGAEYKDFHVQLTPEEVDHGGPFYDFHQKLTELIENNESFDFFRPYKEDLGGVSPEKWHLSYAPLSQKYLEQFSFKIFEKNIQESDLLLKDIVLARAEDVYTNYITNIFEPNMEAPESV